MLGLRKKVGVQKNQEQLPSKKKWQLELEEEERIDDNIDLKNLENIAIPESKSDDDEKNNEKSMGFVNVGTVEEPKSEQKIEPVKTKVLEWMDSEDDIGDDIHASESEMEVIKKEVEVEEENEDPDNRSIFVSNIPIETSERDIEALFNTYGKIKNIDVPRNQGDKNHKGRAFIEYSKRSEAALEANGIRIKNKEISVTLGINAVTTTMAVSEKKNNPLKIHGDYRDRSRRDAFDKKHHKKRVRSSSESNDESESNSEDDDDDEDDSKKSSSESNSSRSRSSSSSSSDDSGDDSVEDYDSQDDDDRRNKDKYRRTIKMSKSRSRSRSRSKDNKHKKNRDRYNYKNDSRRKDNNNNRVYNMSISNNNKNKNNGSGSQQQQQRDYKYGSNDRNYGSKPNKVDNKYRKNMNQQINAESFASLQV